MKPRRVSTKFYVLPDSTAGQAATPELSPFIAMFHRFIQEKTLPGLLLDVADYAHVPDGPGILLVGHAVDYGIDLTEGRPGLLVTRKRYGELPAAEALRATLRSALLAAHAIESDGSGGLRFGTGEVAIQLLDRLACPNDDEHYEQALKELSPLLSQLFGEKHEISRAHAEEPRKPLTLRVDAADAGAAAELALRLGD